MLWVGLFFEFPLVIYILTSIGLIKPQVLLQQWRLAIIIIAILAAIITPTIDPVNMGLVMLPMTLLYFVSIGLSYIAYAGRRRSASETETSVYYSWAIFCVVFTRLDDFLCTRSNPCPTHQAWKGLTIHYGYYLVNFVRLKSNN